MICSCKATANKSGNSTLVLSLVTTKQDHKSYSSNNQAKIFNGKEMRRLNGHQTSSTQMLISDSTVNNTNPTR
jgi:hypothetical protein